MSTSCDFVVPSVKEYVKALKSIRKMVSAEQKEMLGCHFRAHRQSVTFSTLADAIGTDDYEAVITEYGNLGQMLGDRLKMAYLESISRPGEPFYCSALGSGNPYRSEDENYQLVMHRELAMAIEKVKWFK